MLQGSFNGVLCGLQGCLKEVQRVFKVFLEFFTEVFRVFKEVLRVLEVDGLFAFGLLGPKTMGNFFAKLEAFREFKSYELPADKHDLGDLLIKSGFESPILASTNVVLKYSNVRSALNEMRRFLYLCPIFQKNTTLANSKLKATIFNCLEECRGSSGNIELEIEFISGHAWRGNKIINESVSNKQQTIFFKK